MYNSVTLVGRMVNNAEIFVSSNDVKVARFRFAVDLPKSRQTESKSADFFKCTAFKGAAECIERYTHKGAKLLIHGKLSSSSYTNKEGQKINSTEIIVHEIELLDTKNTKRVSNGEPIPQQQEPDFEEYEVEMIYDDGVPF